MEYRKIPIKGFENYRISEYGDVLNVKTGTVRKIFVNPHGYATVSRMINAKKKTFLTHRLVALAFLTPNGWKIVNHKDGNKLNNHYSNLEWCSQKHNALHSIHALGNDNSRSSVFVKGNPSRSIGCRVLKGKVTGDFPSFKAAGDANGVHGSYLAGILRRGIKSTQFIVEKI